MRRTSVYSTVAGEFVCVIKLIHFRFLRRRSSISICVLRHVMLTNITFQGQLSTSPTPDSHLKHFHSARLKWCINMKFPHIINSVHADEVSDGYVEVLSGIFSPASIKIFANVPRHNGEKYIPLRMKNIYMLAVSYHDFDNSYTNQCWRQQCHFQYK